MHLYVPGAQPAQHLARADIQKKCPQGGSEWVRVKLAGNLQSTSDPGLRLPQ